jgi:hypothetical protein
MTACSISVETRLRWGPSRQAANRLINPFITLQARLTFCRSDASSRSESLRRAILSPGGHIVFR